MKFVRENSLTLVTLVLFGFAVVGQALTGSRVTFVARGGPIQDGTSGVSANGQ